MVYSQSSFGESSTFAAFYYVVPKIPDAPQDFEQDPSYENYSKVKFIWVPPLSDGGSQILAYSIACKIADEKNSSLWILSDKITGYQYTSSGFVPGVNYLCRIRCSNRVGTGAVSPVINVQLPILYQLRWTEDLIKHSHYTEHD